MFPRPPPRVAQLGLAKDAVRTVRVRLRMERVHVGLLRAGGRRELPDLLPRHLLSSPASISSSGHPFFGLVTFIRETRNEKREKGYHWAAKPHGATAPPLLAPRCVAASRLPQLGWRLASLVAPVIISILIVEIIMTVVVIIIVVKVVIIIMILPFFGGWLSSMREPLNQQKRGQKGTLNPKP